MPARLPSCRPFRARNRAAALLAVVVAGVGCREEPPEVEGDASELPSAVPAPSLAGVDAAAPPPPPSASVQLARAEPESLPPQLGALAYATTIYEKPKSTSRKLGYLRVGARVGRSEEPVGKRGCKGGWYRIEPEGYVCVGTDATLDMRHPLLRAASVRPAKDRPMPYRYGFVRSVLPLYLRVPSSQQQFKSEFKLKEHLEWFQEHRDEVQRAEVGASDLPVDKWGRVLRGKRAGELGRRRNSSELGVGQLFGGLSSEDPWPFWLREGQRLIPNISGFHVPQYAVFADRARRHTGLAFVGSFATDAHHLGRRFAVTTDLRLAPTTKVKPDAASPWHGVELEGAFWGQETDVKLPIGIIRRRGVQAYRIIDGMAEPAGDLERRSVHRLAGKVKKVEGERYYLLSDGRWAFHKDIGIALRPAKFPYLAKKGERWIEVDLSEQVLTLWEGTKPVFVTLVSTGRPAIGDPDKTNATPRGIYRIVTKHVTATMDSDQGAGRGLKPGDAGYVPQKGDGQYGKTLRRGHGTFKLRDVPYIQYFHKQFAIHGAYWHDVFGIARSHGCINLAPADALRVFKFTTPIPDGWHGANLDKGTAILIHK